MQKARCHAGPRGRRSNRLEARGFRVCFTPLLEVLFTFPSRYSCAIGLSVVFSLAGWSPPIPAEFLVLRGTQGSAWPGGRFRVRGCHPLWPRVPARSAAAPRGDAGGPTTPGAPRRARFGLLRGRSPLLAQSFLFSLPAGTGMFRFPAFAPRLWRGAGTAPGGFPHSDIRGSLGTCPSPRLFAACHVLRRLREPQASPARP